MPVAEVDTDYFERPAGSTSKLNTYRDGVRILRVMITLFKNERPLAFFSWAALCLGLVAVGLSIPVFITYVETGLVPRFPTAILSSTLMLLAFLSLVGRARARHGDARTSRGQTLAYLRDRRAAGGAGGGCDRTATGDASLAHQRSADRTRADQRPIGTERVCAGIRVVGSIAVHACIDRDRVCNGRPRRISHAAHERRRSS